VRKNFSIPVFLLYFWPILFSYPTANAANQHRLFDPTPIYVSITNFHASESVRCQFVLAHFVTYDPPILLPGETLVTSITRGQDDSTLFLVQSGKAMAVEDLFCALDSAWSDTRMELSLAALQTNTTPHLVFSCGIEPEFSCVAKDP
jgi:hypothetical protein